MIINILIINILARKDNRNLYLDQFIILLLYYLYLDIYIEDFDLEDSIGLSSFPGLEIISI